MSSRPLYFGRFLITHPRPHTHKQTTHTHPTHILQLPHPRQKRSGHPSFIYSRQARKHNDRFLLSRTFSNFQFMSSILVIHLFQTNGMFTLPSVLRIMESAPCCNNAIHTSTFPLMPASWRGVKFQLSRAFTSALWRNNDNVTST